MFDIKLLRWQVGRYLKGLGYSSQKAISKTFKQKPEKLKQWLAEENPSLQKKSKKEKL